MRTSKSFDASMHLDMFIQVRPLGEAESTFWEGAYIRSLIGMDPQMVKEIVPFPEMFATVLVIALKNLYKSLRLRILECEDPKFLCSWHMFLNLDWSQIEGVSALDEHSYIVWDVVKGIAAILEVLYLWLEFSWLLWYEGFLIFREILSEIVLTFRLFSSWWWLVWDLGIARMETRRAVHFRNLNRLQEFLLRVKLRSSKVCLSSSQI